MSPSPVLSSADESAPLFKMSLSTKICGLFLLTALLIAGVVLGSCLVLAYEGAEKNVATTIDKGMKVAWSELYHLGKDIRIEDGKLKAGDTVLNGDTAFPEKVSALVGGDVTVFMNDTRVTTNIRKSDGSLATGTTLDRNAAYDAVFSGKSFRGTANILGVPHITGYDPIKDASGKVIGILFVGLPSAQFYTAIEKSISLSLLISLAVATVVFGGVLLVVRRSIIKPLSSMTLSMKGLSTGNLSVEIPEVASHDEILDMADALHLFRKTMKQSEEIKLSQQKQREEKEKALQHQGKLIEQFNEKIVEVIRSVIISVKALEDNAHNMALVSEETDKQTNAVAIASQHAAQNVQTVAAATQDLVSSSRKIATQVDNAKAISEHASTEAATTDQMMRNLADASAKIGDVVKLINDIASQTNLLALNATIEAARAGEAGKGFAVVASEVKSLANQTSKATEEIAGQISSVQEQTNRAVQAINDIAATITKMDEVSIAIAAAVEEQGQATHKITENIQQANAETAQVASNIGDITQNTQQSAKTVQVVFSSAQGLGQQAESMRAVADDFLVRLQSGGGTLEWGPAWVTGHPVVDEDHKRLVHYVNELNTAMKKGVGHDIASEILNNLVQYTVDHFAREEDIWTKGNLSSLDQHKKTHAALVKQVGAFQKDFLDGKATLTADLMTFLREWLINHVFKTDKAGIEEISHKKKA